MESWLQISTEMWHWKQMEKDSRDKLGGGREGRETDRSMKKKKTTRAYVSPYFLDWFRYNSGRILILKEISPNTKERVAEKIYPLAKYQYEPVQILCMWINLGLYDT